MVSKPNLRSPDEKKSTTIAIDLAKHSYQVCKLHRSAGDFNQSFTRDKLKFG